MKQLAVLRRPLRNPVFFARTGDRARAGRASRTCTAALACLFSLLLLTAGASAADTTPDALVDDYIDAWVEFYPSRAFAYGHAPSAAHFEDYSRQRLERWLAFNEETAAQVRGLLNSASPPVGSTWVDLQVLLAQTRNERARWEEDEPLSRQPQWYAEQISQALTHLLVRDQLSQQERSDALAERLRGVTSLAAAAMENLGGGSLLRTQRALATLGSARRFYENGLPELVSSWPPATGTAEMDTLIKRAARAIGDLEAFLTGEILPKADSGAAIGAVVYDAKLTRRTDGYYRAATLGRDARAEMIEVRALMQRESERWAESLADAETRAELLALDADARLAAALEAMEADRQSNQADFLDSFRDLTAAAERFVIDNGIATVPQPTTLLIDLSPAHFSGAAVGGVYPSGAFDPQADTLFYIPSIPDSAPEAAKEGFYRSFNDHFNAMILSHEMFPGHYMQYKVAVTEAPMLRSLFSNGSYVEGWGSFVEELMLDAGWADNAPLTRLAHLRKRLENATRAYVSVMVNTQSWDREQVIGFAVEEGLLAPQFASNLWTRVVNSPMQITDYFTGYRQFIALYDKAGAKGDAEASRRWVDAVLRAGALPPMTLLEDEIARLLAEGSGQGAGAP